MAQKQTHIKTSGRTAGRPDRQSDLNFEDMLVAVGQKKDKDCFVSLFEHFAPRIKSFMMKSSIDPELADELAQETMLTVWHKAEGFNPEKAAASTWIYTIARNKKVDALRKQRPGNTIDLESLPLQDSTPGPGESAMRNEENTALAAAFETLPKEQSDLIHKSFFEGKSHSEIAEETGIPLGTIKSRIRLALQRLRKEAGIKDLR